MTDLSRLRRQAILKQSTGCIELAELLVETDKPVPASAAHLLRRALATLAELPPEDRATPAAQLLTGEALRALGQWQEALEPLRLALEQRHRILLRDCRSFEGLDGTWLRLALQDRAGNRRLLGALAREWPRLRGGG